MASVADRAMLLTMAQIWHRMATRMAEEKESV